MPVSPFFVGGLLGEIAVAAIAVAATRCGSHSLLCLTAARPLFGKTVG